MKNILKILACIAIALTTATCADELPDGVISSEPRELCLWYDNSQKSGDFTIDCDATAQAFSIIVKATNVSWSISTSADWLTLSAKNGNSDEDVKVSIEAFTSYINNRTAVLTFRSTQSGYDVTRCVTVSQKSSNPLLSVSQSLVNFGAKAESTSLTIESNVEWTYSVTESWISVSQSGNTLNLSVQENTGDSRTAYIKLQSTIDGAVKTLATVEVKQETGIHEYVDLGLPSGLLWATCNVGASSPEEYGYYFAWGETATKSGYSVSTSTTHGKEISELQSAGIIDSNNTLTADYDAATKNWGAVWRMPTRAEFEELIDKCTWEWTTLNGVPGRKVTGPNGNSIFLPAAGYYYGTSLYYPKESGYYWSSTAYSGTSDAYNLDFGSSHFDMGDGSRYDGRSVRPVTEP